MNPINLTNNGKCSCCGECCSDVLPLLQDDINRLKKYVRKHKIKPQPKKKLLVFVDPDYKDLSCPFRDDKNRICTVYEARPWICQVFKCDQTPAEYEPNRAYAHQKGKTTSLRYAIYGDPQNNDIAIMSEIGVRAKIQRGEKI